MGYGSRSWVLVASRRLRPPRSMVLGLATVGWLGGRIGIQRSSTSAVCGWRLAILAIVAKIGQSVCLVSIRRWILQRLIGLSAKAHDTSRRRRPPGTTLTEAAEAQAEHQYEEPKASSSSNDGNPLGTGCRCCRPIIFVRSNVFATKTDIDKILVNGC